MERIKSDLKLLCQASGVAGLFAIAEAAQSLLSELVDTVEMDAMGNVIAMRRGNSENAPTILLEAHLDEIGFLVTHIDENGFVHVAAAGGVDERVLTAQPVIVHGEREYTGVFCSTPPHLSKKEGELPDLSDRAIDLGLNEEEAKSHIPLGSRVSFAPDFCTLNENIVCSKALDDRAGVAAILHCLRQLKESLPINIAVALCVQEELGCRGSVPAVNRIKPSAAIVTDVSFAATPDADPYHCGKLSDGVMIGISPILHTPMSSRLLQLAQEKGIAYQTEVMGGTTGTDADMISKAIYGIPTALLSIPQRYMHTPVELVDMRDVAAVGELMAAYIREGGIADA